MLCAIKAVLFRAFLGEGDDDDKGATHNTKGNACWMGQRNVHTIKRRQREGTLTQHSKTQTTAQLQPSELTNNNKSPTSHQKRGHKQIIKLSVSSLMFDCVCDCVTSCDVTPCQRNVLFANKFDARNCALRAPKLTWMWIVVWVVDWRSLLPFVDVQLFELGKCFPQYGLLKAW